MRACKGVHSYDLAVVHDFFRLHLPEPSCSSTMSTRPTSPVPSCFSRRNCDSASFPLFFVSAAFSASHGFSCRIPFSPQDAIHQPLQHSGGAAQFPKPEQAWALPKQQQIGVARYTEGATGTM